MASGGIWSQINTSFCTFIPGHCRLLVKNMFCNNSDVLHSCRLQGKYPLQKHIQVYAFEYRETKCNHCIWSNPRTTPKISERGQEGIADYKDDFCFHQRFACRGTWTNCTEFGCVKFSVHCFNSFRPSGVYAGVLEMLHQTYLQI